MTRPSPTGPQPLNKPVKTGYDEMDSPIFRALRPNRRRLLRLALATAALLGCVAGGLAWWVGR